MDGVFNRKELICTINEERSFSRAARKLFISQPSLSVLVKKVEDEIGVPLFDRSCKPLRLTHAGEAYIEAAKKMSLAEKEFLNYVASVNDMSAGSLTIGSNQLLSTLILPAYISNYIKQYPHIKVDMQDASSAKLEIDLKSGKLDFVLDTAQLDTALYDCIPLSREQLIIAVPASFEVCERLKDYRLTHDDILVGKHIYNDVPSVPLGEFANEPFMLMSKGDEVRRRCDSIFVSQSFHPKCILEIDRHVTLYQFIQRGTAVSIISDSLVCNGWESRGDMYFFKLAPSEATNRQICLYSKRNRYRTKAMDAFITTLLNSDGPFRGGLKII